MNETKHTPLRLVRYQTDKYPPHHPDDARIVGPDNICYGILFGSLEQVRAPQDDFIAAINSAAELTRLREVNKGLTEALTNARSWVRFYKDESATACLAQIDAALNAAKETNVG